MTRTLTPWAVVQASLVSLEDHIEDTNSHLPRAVVQVRLVTSERQHESSEDDGQRLQPSDELETQHRPHLETLAQIATNKRSQTRRAQRHTSCGP